MRFLPLNAVIRLSIESPETGVSIPATCRVAFVRDAAAAVASGKPAGMGLEILDITTSDRPLLEKLLANRKGVVPPKPEPRDEREEGEETDGPLRVVVADDDARYRETAAEPFRKRGDAVTVTADGLEALAACLKEPPDVILSDVQMPRMDRLATTPASRARSGRPWPPVPRHLSHLSQRYEPERIARLSTRRPARYIPKPYDVGELLMRCPSDRSARQEFAADKSVNAAAPCAEKIEARRHVVALHVPRDGTKERHLARDRRGSGAPLVREGQAASRAEDRKAYRPFQRHETPRCASPPTRRVANSNSHLKT